MDRVERRKRVVGGDGSSLTYPVVLNMNGSFRGGGMARVVLRMMSGVKAEGGNWRAMRM